MASIDKIYANFKEYQSLLDWAKGKEVTFFDGSSKKIEDYVYDHWDENDFKEVDRPVMNTPTWLDSYLIKHCPLSFVIERMKEVYDEEDYSMLEKLNLTAFPEGLQRGRKVKIETHSRSRFPIHNVPFKSSRGKAKSRKVKWWLQCDNRNYWYNDGTKVWTDYKLYPANTNTSLHKSLKSLVRFLRKQYLPAGIEFIVSGRYVGEEYKIKVK